MTPTGIVFNIQKFSLHDGPGIRTTVFLKGCPLRCRWCSNPESQSFRVQMLYDASKCVHCGRCAAACTKGAVTRRPEDVRIDHAQCDGCLSCEEVCPGGALTHEGDRRTVEDVVTICLQDIDFYEESEGGVTISGGEGMSQPDFTEALVHALKVKGIHTAIETTGAVPEAIFDRLAPLFDLILFDVKHWDDTRHREGTGGGTESLHANLGRARAAGLNILPRVPVIPGFNDTLADAAGIASLLTDIGLTRVQLLPFHQMGERKYTFLGRKYELGALKPLHPEDLTAYKDVFCQRGIDCFI